MCLIFASFCVALSGFGFFLCFFFFGFGLSVVPACCGVLCAAVPTSVTSSATAAAASASSAIMRRDIHIPLVEPPLTVGASLRARTYGRERTASYVPHSS